VLVKKCDLFIADPTLTSSSSALKWQVSIAVFRELVSALDGKTVTIVTSNFRRLSPFCDEFGFDDLDAPLSEFRASEDIKKNAEAHIAILIKEMNHRCTLLEDQFTFPSKYVIF
jgi:hypothetical protein